MLDNFPTVADSSTDTPQTRTALIQAAPGISPKNHLLVLSCYPYLKFVVFNGYGHGTGSNEDYKLLKELRDKGIHCFRTSSLENGCADSVYESGERLERIGVIGLNEITAKQAVEYIQNNEPPFDLSTQQIAGMIINHYRVLSPNTGYHP